MKPAASAALGRGAVSATLLPLVRQPIPRRIRLVAALLVLAAGANGALAFREFDPSPDTLARPAADGHELDAEYAWGNQVA